jgi:hypothetical protein
MCPFKQDSYHDKIKGEALHEWFQRILHNLDFQCVTVIHNMSHHTVDIKVAYNILGQDEYFRLSQIKRNLPGEVEMLSQDSKYRSIHHNVLNKMVKAHKVLH